MNYYWLPTLLKLDSDKKEFGWYRRLPSWN